MSGEALFFHDIVGGGRNHACGDDFSASSAEPFDDDDAEGFSTSSLPKVDDESLSDHSGGRPTEDRLSNPPPAPPALNVPAEITLQNPPPRPDDAAAANSENEPPTTHTDEPPPIPKGKGLAHHYFMANKVKVCSFDLETAGEFAGVVQMSAKLSSPKFVNGKCVGFNHLPHAVNKYVQPPEGVYWNTAACAASHNLTPNSPQIRSANDFAFVWAEFCLWINENVPSNETCILTAYCGETCDMRWIWKYVQAPRSQLSMPRQFRFFMDPKFVIGNYKGCKLHPSKSKVGILQDVLQETVQGNR